MTDRPTITEQFTDEPWNESKFRFQAAALNKALAPEDEGISYIDEVADVTPEQLVAVHKMLKVGFTLAELDIIYRANDRLANSQRGRA